MGAGDKALPRISAGTDSNLEILGILTNRLQAPAQVHPDSTLTGTNTRKTTQNPKAQEANPFMEAAILSVSLFLPSPVATDRRQ